MDHPRSRGVYLTWTTAAFTLTGSSPLARGLQCRTVPLHNGRRIIPARAGFTSNRRNESSRSGDHPRSRGVYFRNAFTMDRRSGSSPLARGLRAKIRIRLIANRIIPARAGFTAP